MNFSKLPKIAEKVVSDNATAILTGVGVVGTVATAVLTGRASFKAASIIAGEEEAHILDPDWPEISKKGKVVLVWPLYLPAIGTGTATITAIIFANRISSKRMAALAAAYGLSEKAFGEYKDKALQHLGINKEQELKDELAQDKVNLKPPQGQTIIIGEGEVLCFDAITGRYFKSSMEKIRQAENKVNYEIIHHHAASLSSFYDEIGLPCTSYSDDVGWNVDNLIEVTYTSVLADDKPCLVIDFKVAPITGYGRIY